MNVYEVFDSSNCGPETRVPARSLDTIIVAPYYSTVPGGYGPPGERAPLS